MRKLYAILVLLSISIVMLAQDEQKDPNEIRTILGYGGTNGAYGGISVGYASIDKLDAVVMGMSGAWIINHSFAIGAAGSAFISDFKYDDALNRNVNLTGGYGGLMLEPILFAKSPVHISIPIVIGAGGIAYARERMHNDDDYNYYYNDNDYSVEDACPYAFIKPGIEVEMNMVSFIRLSLGAYYMETTKLDLNNTSKNALSGLSAMLTLKFGLF
jgi:hypothetical protein